MNKTLFIVWNGIRIFNKNSCFNAAAAISFYAFFALIPLMILITAALGYVLGTHEGLLDKVIAMVKQNIPYISDRIINDVRGLAKTWKTFGWLSLIFLLSSAEMVLEATATTLTSIFETGEKFRFFRRKVVNFLVLLLAVFASFLSISITAASIILGKVRPNIPGIDILYYLLQSLAFKLILPFLLMSSIVAVVFRILSGPNLNLRYALYGSFLFTALWEAAKQLFTWYVYNFPAYNRFYGSLGTLMVLLLWIFYSANIFLFSASVAKAAYDNHTAAQKKHARHVRFKKATKI